MEAATVDKIANLANQVPKVVATPDGQVFLTEKLVRVEVFDPRPASYGLTTLSGARDYLKANVEGVDLGKVIAHVVDYGNVAVETAFEGETKKRTNVLNVSLDKNLKTFQFGQWMNTDDFILAARTLFEGTPGLDEVVRYASLVVAEDGVTLSDNGVSTTVQLKRGVRSGLKEEAESSGFYQLIPFRTFREISQVESLFLFRMKVTEEKQLKVALFEADGGAWRLEAVSRIKDWIVDQIPGITVIA